MRPEMRVFWDYVGWLALAEIFAGGLVVVLWRMGNTGTTPLGVAICPIFTALYIGIWIFAERRFRTSMKQLREEKKKKDVGA